MGLRVRKSIKVAPGVKVNVGKKSVGVSVGNKHGGVSVNSKTGVTTRVSVPGTGVSYTQNVSSKKKTSPQSSRQQNSQNASPASFMIAGIFLLIAGLIAVGVGMHLSEVMTSMSTVVIVIGALCALLGIAYIGTGRKNKK